MLSLCLLGIPGSNTWVLPPPIAEVTEACGPLHILQAWISTQLTSHLSPPIALCDITVPSFSGLDSEYQVPGAIRVVQCLSSLWMVCCILLSDSVCLRSIHVIVYATNSFFEAKHTITYIHSCSHVPLGCLSTFQFLWRKLLQQACIYLLKACSVRVL